MYRNDSAIFCFPVYASCIQNGELNPSVAIETLCLGKKGLETRNSRWESNQGPLSTTPSQEKPNIFDPAQR